MALGFCPAVLSNLKNIAECNTPSTKITPAGFLKLLWENRPTIDIINSDSALRLDDGSGHIRDLILRYLKRAVPAQAATVASCDIDVVQSYQEAVITATDYRQISTYVSDEDLARYCADATEMVRINGFPTPFMREFLDRILTLANGLIGSIDTALLTAQLTKFGVNVVTGTNAATTVNFPGTNAGVDNLYSESMIKILQDAALNEMCGDLLIAGHGNFNAFTLQQMVACCSQLGIDSSRFTGFNFYPDIYSQTIWGANHIGVFSKGSVGLVELLRYKGWRNRRAGTSEFFTMPLPVDCAQCNNPGVDSMEFDVQLRYVDCPTTINIGCSDETSVPPGYILTIGKSFGLFNVPTDAYQSEADDDCYTDRLAGNNGSLRYIITNV